MADTISVAPNWRRRFSIALLGTGLTVGYASRSRKKSWVWTAFSTGRRRTAVSVDSTSAVLSHRAACALQSTECSALQPMITGPKSIFATTVGESILLNPQDPRPTTTGAQPTPTSVSTSEQYRTSTRPPNRPAERLLLPDEGAIPSGPLKR